MIEGKGLISIWFFIGVLLLAYGIIIFAAGVYHLYVPPEHPVVLARLARPGLVGRFLIAGWRHSTRIVFSQKAK